MRVIRANVSVLLVLAFAVSCGGEEQEDKSGAGAQTATTDSSIIASVEIATEPEVAELEAAESDEAVETSGGSNVIFTSFVITALSSLVFLLWRMKKDVAQMNGEVSHLIAVAKNEESSELLTVRPLREELEKIAQGQDGSLKSFEGRAGEIRQELKQANEKVNHNLSAVVGELKNSRSAVGDLEKEMVSIRDLANSKTAEIDEYREGVRLSGLKGSMGEVIKALLYVRSTAAENPLLLPEEPKNFIEATLENALMSCGIEEYGQALVGKPFGDHVKECEAVLNEVVDVEYGSGVITSCGHPGYRIQLKSDGEYHVLKLASVAINPIERVEAAEEAEVSSEGEEGVVTSDETGAEPIQYQGPSGVDDELEESKQEETESGDNDE